MGKILIIDDDENITDMLSAFADILGKKATCKNHWKEQLFEESLKYDAMVLDLQMPEFDGFDILDYLSGKGFTKPIILISGLDITVIDSSVKLAKTLGLDVRDGLQKPFGMQEFANALVECEKPSAIEAGDVNTSDEKHDASNIDVDHCLNEELFNIVYQPQINLITNNMEGVECLSRLHHPDYGMIPPPVFIEKLEQKNLISKFTLQMMRKSLKELSLFFQRGSQFSISFNISALSLNQEFMEGFLAEVDAREIPAQLITLELTETSALAMNADAERILTKLRIKGFTLSVDDFGTGYSTIKQLNDLPFNEIKIDRCFVRDIGTRKTAEAIISATTELANKLNYDIVCEGIETKEQLEFLLGLNCHVYQGFMFAKPLSFFELSSFLFDVKDQLQQLEQSERNVSIINRLETESIDILCVELGRNKNERLFNSLSQNLGHCKTIEVAQLNTVNWEETDVVILNGATCIAQLHKIKPLIQSEIVVLYQHISQEELIDLFEMGVTEALDARTLPVEIMHRVYKIVMQHRNFEQALITNEVNHQMAIEAMKQASQYGTIVQFIKDALTVDVPHLLAQQTIQYFHTMQLHCIVQLRDGHKEITVGSDGNDNSALVNRVIHALKDKGRVYEYQTRLVFNSDNTSILILNKPQDETELGSLRDIGAAVIEVLEEKWTELLEHSALSTLNEKLLQISVNLSNFASELNEESISSLDQIASQINQSFDSLNLTLEQEELLMCAIKEALDKRLANNGLDSLIDMVNEVQDITRKRVNN